MCVLFEFRQFVFYSGNSSTYFKVLCRSLQKNLIVRDVLRFQFLSTISDPKLLGPRYNINWNSKSAERAKAFWFSEGRMNSDSSVVRDE